jgi:hypothetical protein
VKYNKEQLEFFKKYLSKQGYRVDGIETLEKPELKKAFNAYRQYKKRKSDAEKGKSKKTINLTQAAHDILCNLAKLEGVTLSQWIINNLGEFSPHSTVTLSHKKSVMLDESKVLEIVPLISAKIIRVTYEDFNIEIEMKERTSTGVMAGHCKHSDSPIKKEIYNVIIACRSEKEIEKNRG